jgi:hypothetical protein
MWKHAVEKSKPRSCASLAQPRYDYGTYALSSQISRPGKTRCLFNVEPDHESQNEMITQR